MSSPRESNLLSRPLPIAGFGDLLLLLLRPARR
jgi:hypothetical protein